jgi:hypothetical protein
MSTTTEQRDALLQMLAKWSFPASDWERATVDAITRLPAVTVHRYPADLLEQMRMKPQECHVNARFMEEKDPEKATRRVLGWWVQPAGNACQFVLHSVIQRHGVYHCVTPVDPRVSPEPTFPFVPDPQIEPRAEGNTWSYYRDRVRIIHGVRSNPTQTIADCAAVRERLLAGMDPFEALQRPLPP